MDLFFWKKRGEEIVDILILEDDAYTREFFIMLLREISGVNNIIETSTGGAIKLAKYHRPDLILLDIELNNDDLNGLEVAKHIYSFDQNVYLVFLTAHSQYAINSFAVHPYSYILKPIVIDEFIMAIKEIEDKVKEKRIQNDHSLVVSSGSWRYFIPKNDIVFIEARGKKTIINAKLEQWVTYRSLGSLNRQLNNDFIRVHRSFIVNLKQVKSLTKIYDRTYEIEFWDHSQKIPVSRNAYINNKHLFTV